MVTKVELLDADEFAASFSLSEELRNKSILITGASGLIGRTLVRCLERLNSEHSLNLFLHTPRHTELEEWIETNTEHVDYIIHLACPTSSREMVDHPVEVIDAITTLTKRILDFAKKEKSSMVYASSMEVYGINHTDNPISEHYQGYLDPLQARSSYPMAKRMAECLCYCYAKEYGVNVKIARLVQTFGAGISASEQRVFAQFAHSVVDGRDITLHTEGRTSRKYLYLTDAVSALLFIMLKGAKGEAYNAAHPDSYVSIRQMAEMLREEFNPSIKVNIERQANLPYLPELHLNLSTQKLEALGWKAMIPLREMYARLIQGIKDDVYEKA